MKTVASARDQAELLRRLGLLREDSVRRWGRMSAHQMVCHLSDGYRLLTGQRPTSLVRTPLPRPMMNWLALYSPFQWPSGIVTTPELDQNVTGTKPTDFAVDLNELKALLQMVASDRRGPLKGRVHPIFGPMSESAWLRWAYLHADHHLRQFGL
jgi:hypothetical protein